MIEKNNLITLAIETSTSNISIAILKGNSVLASSEAICQMNHDKYIIAIVKSIMNISKIKKEDINLVAVGCGPGAFTSLRVGISFARAFAQFNKINIVAVNTLDTIKENIQEIILTTHFDQAYIISMINAKQNKVYASIYHKQKNIYQNLYEDTNELISKLKDIIKDKHLFMIGNAAEKYKNIFTAKLNKIYTLSDYYNHPHSNKTALLGQEIFKERGDMNFANIKPFYINQDY